MTSLHLHILRFRVWLARRRLRKMGFRDMGDFISPETILRLWTDAPVRKRHFRWFEAVFLILGIGVWPLFDLRFTHRSVIPKTQTSPDVFHVEGSP